MKTKQTAFNIIKILFLMVILAELSVIKVAISPSCAMEYITVLLSLGTYIEHFVLSIVFISAGALIFLWRE